MQLRGTYLHLHGFFLGIALDRALQKLSKTAMRFFASDRPHALQSPTRMRTTIAEAMLSYQELLQNIKCAASESEQTKE